MEQIIHFLGEGESPTLKLRSCRLYNNKYMIVLTQITNTEIFALKAVLSFKLLSFFKLLKSEKTVETVKK